ncbi:hypothetical protein ASD81_11170 [Nocardioides sp. Root614]|nr:hypothetical protein ASD81_11170 [Nocardioides sp. Root614]KRA93059.1 hypothetical protein ASD84_11435 [Nocardioides sp. Root682]
MRFSGAALVVGIALSSSISGCSEEKPSENPGAESSTGKVSPGQELTVLKGSALREVGGDPLTDALEVNQRGCFTLDGVLLMVPGFTEIIDPPGLKTDAGVTYAVGDVVSGVARRVPVADLPAGARDQAVACLAAEDEQTVLDFGFDNEE